MHAGRVHGAELVLETIAVVLQVVGLITVAVGLGRAWAENPDDASLAGRIFGPPIRFVWHTLLGAPRWPTRVTSTRDAVWAIDELRAVRTRGLDPAAPLHEQVGQVKREVDEAAAVAYEAMNLSERAHRKIESLELATNSRIDVTRAELQDTARREAANGVPVALVGLLATMAGTLTQYAAGFLS